MSRSFFRAPIVLYRRHRFAWNRLAPVLGLPLDPRDESAAEALEKIRSVARGHLAHDPLSARGHAQRVGQVAGFLPAAGLQDDH